MSGSRQSSCSALVVVSFLIVFPTPSAFAQNRCDALKLACSAKRLGCELKVQAKALATGAPADAQKLQKCADKYDGGSTPEKGCFARLEARQDPLKPATECTVTGDNAIVGDALQTCKNDLLSLLTTARTTISGTTRDYFSAAPVPAVSLTTRGLVPEVAAGSGGSGEFSLSVPSTSELSMVAAKSGSTTTLGELFEVTGTPLARDVEIVAAADTLRQYTTLGLVPTAGKGMIIVDLRADDDSPLVGIPAADVGLFDDSLSPATASGPYFFGAGGDVVDNGTLSNSAAFGGRARAAFLDCDPDDYTVRVADVPDLWWVVATCIPDGVTLVSTR